MRILIVGATGTIGVPVVQALEVRHEVIPASNSRSALTVDLGLNLGRQRPLRQQSRAVPHHPLMHCFVRTKITAISEIRPATRTSGIP